MFNLEGPGLAYSVIDLIAAYMATYHPLIHSSGPTQAEMAPIMSIGADETITPFLHEWCRATSRPLITCTDQPSVHTYYSRRYASSGNHALWYINGPRTFMNWSLPEHESLWLRPNQQMPLVVISTRTSDDLAANIVTTFKNQNTAGLAVCIAQRQRENRNNTRVAADQAAYTYSKYWNRRKFQHLLLSDVYDVSVL